LEDFLTTQNWGYFTFYRALYNSKWSKIFQACIQLALKNQFKESPLAYIFFQTNVSLWSTATLFFAGTKEMFFNTNILQSTWWKFQKFFSHLFRPEYYKILYNHMSQFFSKIWYLYKNWQFWSIMGEIIVKEFLG